MKKIAIVTGATSGFGKSIAYKLSENGYDLIITGRRSERLQDISNDLSSKFNTKVLYQLQRILYYQGNYHL